MKFRDSWVYKTWAHVPTMAIRSIVRTWGEEIEIMVEIMDACSSSLRTDSIDGMIVRCVCLSASRLKLWMRPSVVRINISMDLDLFSPCLTISASLVYHCGSDEMEHMNNETNVLGQLLTPGSFTPNAAFFEFPFFTTGQYQKRCGEEVLDHNWSGRHVGDFFVLLQTQSYTVSTNNTLFEVQDKDDGTSQVKLSNPREGK